LHSPDKSSHPLLAHPEQFKEGFHFVGHSQGGLLARAVIEESDDFQIKHFLSLAGVQAGEYGNCKSYFGAFDCPGLTQLLYSWAMRNVTSIAQFWRTPNHTEYMALNAFLPYMNNELEPKLRHKKNFISVGHVYLFASDGDTTIVPWQSSHFGFYDEDEKTIIPMEKQRYYIEDTFGLQTLDKSGRLTLTQVSGQTHGSWLHDEYLLKNYVIPLLNYETY